MRLGCNCFFIIIFSHARVRSFLWVCWGSTLLLPAGCIQPKLPPPPSLYSLSFMAWIPPRSSQLFIACKLQYKDTWKYDGILWTSFFSFACEMPPFSFWPLSTKIGISGGKISISLLRQELFSKTKLLNRNSEHTTKWFNEGFCNSFIFDLRIKQSPFSVLSQLCCCLGVPCFITSLE